MKLITCQLSILFSFICYGQTKFDFKTSDFYINSNGDSLYLPKADSVSNNSKFYFYANNTKVQEIKTLPDDTLLTRFKSSNLTYEYYYKMRKAEGNESYNNHPLVFFKSGIILGSRIGEYLLYVKRYSYYPNGNVKNEQIINSNICRTYSSNGNLYSKADSCNEKLLQEGNYSQYDTLTGKLLIKGFIKPCQSMIGCDPEGWWEFYDQEKMISKKLYKNGIVIEERNFH